jgi:hypothetical protein
MRRAVACAFTALVICTGCGNSSVNGFTVPSVSEMATTAVSGAFNASGGSAVGVRFSPPRTRLLDGLIERLRPFGRAYAATWSCTGGSLTPSFAGPSHDPYAFTPRSCSVTWGNGKTGSSQWSGAFALSYGPACDDAHSWIGDQVAGCSVTRTTASGGNTRTVTGPDGNAYAITHDTNGAGTGWDPSVSPSPTNAGVIATCGAGGCATGGGTLAISGSHLTGVVAGDIPPTKLVDITVSTGAPLTFTTSGSTRVFNGTVTVQANIARLTATATFDAVTFGDPSCCFPTSGTVTTTLQGGASDGRTETLTFGAACGEASLTTTSGRTFQRTLQNCP